jgi:hypothetical protein
VRKLLENKTHGSNWIFSRLHHLDILPPTSVMNFWMYDQLDEVHLSIPQSLPPFLVCVNCDNTSLMKIEHGSQPTILQTEKSAGIPQFHQLVFQKMVH